MKTIILTTAHRGYGEVKLVNRRNNEERKHLFLVFQYGDTVDGKWLPGDLQLEEKIVQNLVQVLDGKGGEIRPADPVYDKLIGVAFPKVTFTSKDGNKRWKKLTRPHPVHGPIDLWVQLSDVASINNIYQHALDQLWFEGSIQ